jgi:hypothetical protein
MRDSRHPDRCRAEVKITAMIEERWPQLTIAAPRAALGRFNALFQRGVATRAVCGSSVYSFLADELGLAADYVRERITTVFLDGQVVDALEDAVLQDGSLLALSAAMPGLAGATLRRSGPLAVMRAAITRTADRASARPPPVGTSIVRIKLFNLLLDEIGPVLLEHGIVLQRAEAWGALGDRAEELSELPAGEVVELRVRLS